MKRILIYSVLCWGLTHASQAGPIQLATDTAHTENFDTLIDSGGTGGGTVPKDSEIVNAQFWTGVVGADISSGWWNGAGTTYGTATPGNNANSSRLLSLGNDDASDRALGLGWRQDGGVNMTIGAQLQNATGGTMTNLNVTYDGEFWYHGGASTVGDLTFDYSLNATSIRDTGAIWVSVFALNFTPPGQGEGTQYAARDGNAAANRVAGISHTISGLNLAPGATLFIRWSNSNSHGMGIDNVSITANTTGGGVVLPPVSGPPTFNTSPTVKPNASTEAAYSESLSGDIAEADGDGVTFTKLTGSSWLSVAGNGVISGNPVIGDVGLNIFSVEVSDVDGASTGTVHVTVDGPAPPTPPGGTVEVDVNWNIEHSVNGISDFGRERHITVHSSFGETDWDGEEDKLDYMMNDLDVYFGRDNGSAGWKFQNTPQDPDRPNMADLSHVTNYGSYLRGQYDLDLDRKAYESRQNELIMGTNPHPLYPTLSWFPNGFAWDGWQPKNVATSAEWVVEYMDHYFRKDGETSGEKLPKYWEVINEPDMKLMTGQFMVSNWESIWEYHNLVADGVRERLGDDAPLIGGMTWGLHDLWQADLPRYDGQHYYDLIYNNNPADSNGAAFYRDAGTTDYPTGDGGYGSWEQWDVVWKGFIDHAGSNMDFYAVHLYDWPAWETPGNGTLRSGGAVEATLDTLEWYDVHSFGIENRKPVVLSEYGSVGGYQQQLGLDRRRQHWEDLKPFSAMMMQFLERPDYVTKSMPFTPVKARWGDYYVDDVLYRYTSSMMDETTPGSGVWEWGEYIKWYELWSDVDGSRVDTKASDLDLQVDAYVDGNKGYLILNNLETTNLVVNLNAFGLASTAVNSVQIKHLYLDLSQGTDGRPVLSDEMLLTPPGSVELGAEATMILCYEFASALVPDETAQEAKFYGESLSGTVPNRVEIGDGSPLTAQINGVTVPAGDAEAVLRISGLFVYNFVTMTDPRNVITINGNTLNYIGDWRGEGGGRPRWFGTIEIPVPKAYLQANNTITCAVLNSVTYSCVGLQVTEFSQAPGRSATAVHVPVTGITVSPATRSMPEQRQGSVMATIAPSNASDKRINWTSTDPSVATVDAFGLITAVSAGTADIIATTVDGGHTGSSALTVTAFVPFEAEGVVVHPAARVIRIDETAPLTETVLPGNAVDKSVIWSSGNPAVATVDSSGVVTAVGEGTVMVTATVNTSSGFYTDSSSITVPPPIGVTGVSISPEGGLLAVGSTRQMSASVTPNDAADNSVTWTSFLPSVATVSSGGLVTGVSAGTAYIVVTTVDGGFSATNETTVFSDTGGGIDVIVEAETFFNTGGVSNSGIGINWVQANDWAEYAVTIPSNGIYQLEYYISSPNNDTGVEFRLDGVSRANDAVPNTGSWEDYVPLVSASYMDLMAGSYTARVVAAATPAWQWNLDKFILTRVGAIEPPPPGSDTGSVLYLYPFVGDQLIVGVSNGQASGSFDVLSATNLMLGGWDVVLSNQTFDAGGMAIITNTASEHQLFLKVEE